MQWLTQWISNRLAYRSKSIILLRTANFSNTTNQKEIQIKPKIFLNAIQRMCAPLSAMQWEGCCKVTILPPISQQSWEVGLSTPLRLSMLNHTGDLNSGPIFLSPLGQQTPHEYSNLRKTTFWIALYYMHSIPKLLEMIYISHIHLLLLF